MIKIIEKEVKKEKKMIKIIEKEVKIVKEYDVEPKTATLYSADKYNKNVIKVENCIFENASPIGWGASDANDYRLDYRDSNNRCRYVIINITTGIVKDNNDYFFDYEQAVKIYRKRRMELLKDRIDYLKDEVTRLKEYQKELEELENFEKKGGEVHV